MKRRLKPHSLPIATGALLALIAGGDYLLNLVINRASSEQHWPGPLDVFRRHPWSLGFALLILLLGLAILLKVTEHGQDRWPVDPALGKKAFSKRSRRMMLRRVRYIDIEGYLQATRPAYELPIRFVRRNELTGLENTIQQARESGEEAHSEANSLHEVFSQVGQALILLGDPGQGKTTQLLRLAKELLLVAEKDRHEPIPVVANLVSWDSGQHSLTEWLTAELMSKYEIPEDVARVWVAQDYLAVLLDGLDEVQDSNRSICMQAIRVFHTIHGLAPIVVCSRSYALQTGLVDLGIHETLELLHPSDADVASYLSAIESSGVSLNEVHIAMSHDPSLRDFLRSPLVLNVVARAYHDADMSSLISSGTNEQRLARLWNKYLRAMFQQRPLRTSDYAAEEAIYWLEWLAFAMSELRASEFRLDRLTKVWSSLGAEALGPPRKSYHMKYGRLDFLVVAPMVGVVGTAGILLLMLTLLSFPFGGPFRAGPLFGLAFALARGGEFPLRNEIIGLLGALSGAAFIMRSRIGHDMFEGDIPVEELSWSWIRFRSHLAESIAVCIVTGLLGGLVATISVAFRTALLSGLVLGIVLSLFSSAVAGLSAHPISDMRVRAMGPTIGIHRAAYRCGIAVAVGAIFGGLFGYWFGGSQAGWPLGIGCAFGIAMAMALRFGGYGLMDYVLTMRKLAELKVAPRGYRKYLDAMVERLLLGRLGGSYVFIHKTLMDYCADSYRRNTPNAPRASDVESGKPVRRLDPALSKIKKFGQAGGFYHFSVETTELMGEAQRIARYQNYIAVDTEHILMAILENYPDLFNYIIDVDANEAKAWLAPDMAPAQQRLWGILPFSRELKKVIRIASNEARNEGADLLEVRHILAGLILGDGTAGALLRAHDVKIDMTKSTGVEDEPEDHGSQIDMMDGEATDPQDVDKGAAVDAAAARDLFAALVPVNERMFGPEYPVPLSARASLALWTGKAGDAAAARDLFAALVPVNERMYGSEHPNTLDVRSQLADWTGEAGNAAAARDLFAALLPVFERVCGTEDPDTLETRYLLASWTGEAGHPRAARKQSAALLPVSERIRGPEHPMTLSVRAQLAEWTGEAGDWAGARDMVVAMLPVYERVFGPEHDRTLVVRSRLAHWTGRTGDAAGARNLTAALLQVHERKFGPEHPDTLTIRHNLAFFTGQAGYRAAARDMFAAMLPVYERVFGPEHQETLEARANLTYWTKKADRRRGSKRRNRPGN